MSELLWTLSLLAQKHFAQSPTVSPLPDLKVIDSSKAIAHWDGTNSLGRAAVVSVDGTRPEFSSSHSIHSAIQVTQARSTPLSAAREDRHSSRQRQSSRELVLNREARGDRPTAGSAQLPQVIKLTKTALQFTSDPSATNFQIPAVVADAMPLPELLTAVSSTLARPSSGSQLYAQRLEAIRQGKTYTRLPANSFQDIWQNATYHPHYEDWLALLAKEADAMARGQGSNRLTIMLGDSLSQWFPNDQLPSDRFWLNQGISGDTSAGVLRRLSLIDQTQPDVIHVMVGINDLRAGATDAELLTNLQKIMAELHQRHPSAQVYVHSLLPTRLPAIPNDRITALNEAIAQIAQDENVAYLDLQTTFSDDDGNLRLELTTDGLHLSRYGYALWQSALRWFQLA